VVQAPILAVATLAGNELRFPGAWVGQELPRTLARLGLRIESTESARGN
jgi:hypothetical protein